MLSLGDHQAVQWILANAAIKLHASRLMVPHATWKLEHGDEARQESSMCKVFVAEAVGRAIDRTIQICGALGIVCNLILERFHRDVRTFRIYDSTSAVHRVISARQVLKGP